MTDTVIQRVSSARSRRAERRSYWALYALTFGLFVVVALVARLMPRRLDPFHTAGGGARRSVLAEAQSAASATIGYAFMG